MPFGSNFGVSYGDRPQPPGCGRSFLLLISLACAFAFTSAWAASSSDGAKQPELKVCADPYMLPFSNRERQGYENKIAALFAKKLGWKLYYYWFPQRMGFIRNTLNKQKPDGSFNCDLVITVPEHFDISATTKPYYTSTYVLVYRKAKFGTLKTPDELEKLAKKGVDIKFGLTDRGPAQLWVFRHGLMGDMVPYQGQSGDLKVTPGEQLMKDLAAGKIDCAIVWGPSAGYYAKVLKAEDKLGMLMLHNDPKYPDMRFEFSVAMGVRRGDKAWADKINHLIENNQSKINSILKSYGIPLLPLKESSQSDDND